MRNPSTYSKSSATNTNNKPIEFNQPINSIGNDLDNHYNVQSFDDYSANITTERLGGTL